jgi:acyl-coenzyme A synthetase/AMP-(fatty) acid ligase
MEVPDATTLLKFRRLLNQHELTNAIFQAVRAHLSERTGAADAPGHGDRYQAVELIRAQGVSFTMASTPFLADLKKAVQDTGTTAPSLKTFLCAGAPIPRPLVEQAREVLSAKIVSAWGMTENGAVTLIRPEDDDERAFSTDGCGLPGVEVKIQTKTARCSHPARRAGSSCAPARTSAAT